MSKFFQDRSAKTVECSAAILEGYKLTHNALKATGTTLMRLYHEFGGIYEKKTLDDAIRYEITQPFIQAGIQKKSIARAFNVSDRTIQSRKRTHNLNANHLFLKPDLYSSKLYHYITEHAPVSYQQLTKEFVINQGMDQDQLNATLDSLALRTLIAHTHTHKSKSFFIPTEHTPSNENQLAEMFRTLQRVIDWVISHLSPFAEDDTIHYSVNVPGEISKEKFDELMSIIEKFVTENVAPSENHPDTTTEFITIMRVIRNNGRENND